MLNIKSVNHIGIRIKDKSRSVKFYEVLGFEFTTDTGFEEGHPIVMKHPSGVVLNLLGPSNMPEGENILMDVSQKYTGITHVALTVASLVDAKKFMKKECIEITGSFSFGGMSAIFIRDPDRNVIELDAYGADENNDLSGYAGHI
ncbi:MAG: glyoxalase [Gammaproteobacteria bacterium]|nr:MAG: glyoxalase [Gammaproteobacteria bacterium]